MVLRRVHIRPNVNPPPPPPSVVLTGRLYGYLLAEREKKRRLGKYCDSGGGGIGANKDDIKNSLNLFQFISSKTFDPKDLYLY
jgi:hypothetical protein